MLIASNSHKSELNRYIIVVINKPPFFFPILLSISFQLFIQTILSIPSNRGTFGFRSSAQRVSQSCSIYISRFTIIQYLRFYLRFYNKNAKLSLEIRNYRDIFENSKPYFSWKMLTSQTDHTLGSLHPGMYARTRHIVLPVKSVRYRIRALASFSSGSSSFFSVADSFRWKRRHRRAAPTRAIYLVACSKPSANSVFFRIPLLLVAVPSLSLRSHLPSIRLFLTSVCNFPLHPLLRHFLLLPLVGLSPSSFFYSMINRG